MQLAWPLPAAGDIVWCRFPHWPGRSPGPKPRPALVLKVTEREDGAEVVVIYGTSQRVDRLSRGEFAITRTGHAAAFEAAGLSFDTKFDFGQAVALPWNDSFFAVPPGAPSGQKPRLGVLHASMMRAASAAYAAVSQP
jgi:hypothetical protein